MNFIALAVFAALIHRTAADEGNTTTTTRPVVSTTRAISSTKMQIMERFEEEVTDFFTSEQVSRAIDLASLAIHRGKNAQDVVEDLRDYVHTAMSKEQRGNLTEAYKGLQEDLNSERALFVVERIKKIIVYAVTPGVEQVKLHTETPQAAYNGILSIFTIHYINSIKSLVQISLTPTEWNSLEMRFHDIIHT